MSRETDENIKIVQALFAATGSGNWPAAEAMLTEDFFVTEADSNVFAGVYRGRKALESLFSHVVSAAGITKLDVKQLCAGGDLVVAMVEMTLGGPPERLITLAEVFRLRDGKVCEIKPHYFDAQPLAEAVAARKKRA
jgi:predicted SnoaL-like aldol condensation-catalyzing enzyme